MKVKVRHFNDATTDARYFTECRFDELDDVIALVQRSGGFYLDGDHDPFH